MTTSPYRQYFTRAECAMLDACPADDLTSELNLLRLLLIRVLAAMKRSRSLGLKSHAAILSAFSASGIVLSRLVRLQLQLHDPMDEIREQIEAGKEWARRRHHVYDYFSPPPSPSAA